MSNVIGKFKELIGFEEGEDNISTVFNEDNNVSLDTPIRNKNGKVVNLNSAKTTKVLIIKPKSYDEAKDISEAIKSNKIVVINTIGLDIKVAQRLVDFISGSAYVLNADLQELEQRIYLLAPNNTEVISDAKNELANKSFFGNINNEE